MSRCIILDGVGINYKTSILNYFQRYGWEVLKSNHYLYDDELLSLFPRAIRYSNRILHRYIELCQITELNRPTIIDRGILNYIIWSQLIYNDIIDVPHDQDDLEFITNNLDKLLDLDRKFNPIKILIKTEDDRLISECLGSSELQHSNVFSNVNTYHRVQDKYIEYYKNLVPSYTMLTIDNSRCSLEKKIRDLIYQIEKINVENNSDINPIVY